MKDAYRRGGFGIFSEKKIENDGLCCQSKDRRRRVEVRKRGQKESIGERTGREWEIGGSGSLYVGSRWSPEVAGMAAHG